MLWVLIQKEWKSVLLSPRFALTFVVTSVLILLSIGIGLRELRAFEAQQSAGRQLLAEELLEQTSWGVLSTRVFRDGDPLHIFVGGVHNDVGRLATIAQRGQAALEHSIYSDDPILAVFRSFDFSLVVQAVLSLFAILFTYDAINGEREAGTLRLILAGAVPRTRLVLAKLVGTGLGLALPLALPVLLGLLLVVLSGVAMDADAWRRLALLLLVSGLYLGVFMAFGIAVSASTRTSRTSFLLLLVAWILAVLVMPRIGLLAAAQHVSVPTVAEMESRRAGFESRAWDDYRRQLEESWRLRQKELAGLDEGERESYEDRNLWRWLEEDEAARRQVEAEIAAFTARLTKDLRLRKAERERLALSLSRWSPASVYRLAALEIAGTGVSLKTRYEDAARVYKQAFTRFVASRSDQAGGHVVRRRGGGRSGPALGASEPLDLSDMPRFQPPARASEDWSTLPGDLGLLATLGLLFFAVGYVGFLRYDVR